MGFQLFGHERVIVFLKRILSGECRFPSSILLYGPQGVGKKSLLQEFIHHYFCSSGSQEYCGQCQSCKLIKHNHHPDLLTLSREKVLKIQEIRDLKNYFLTPPVSSKTKIVFIPDLERMTINASNSFLKMLEEPPSYLNIVATTVHRARIPSTVLSRFMQIPLTSLARADFDKFCHKHLEEPDPAHFRLLFYLTHGSPGKALQLYNDGGILSLRKHCLHALDRMFKSKNADLLYKAMQHSMSLHIDQYFFPLVLILLKDMIYLRSNLDKYIVNTDIYDKIEHLTIHSGISLLWELTDAFLDNLTIKRKIFDQFLWNEFLLWKIMATQVNQ